MFKLKSLKCLPFNGSGVFSPPGANFPAVTGTTISSTHYNAVINDVASGLTNCLTKDGQTTVTANLPMATYRHTGVGNAAALTDYASADQIVDNALTHGGASSGGTDTYAVSLAISPGAYANKQRYQFEADVSNTGACTINFNSIGAANIKLLDGTDPYDGAIQAGGVADLLYDGTNFILLNPFTASSSIPLPVALGGTGGATATAAAANIAGWVLLDAQTASASATIDFEDADGMGSTYDAYKVVITDLLPATDDVELRCRVSVASAYLTTSIYSSAGQGSAAASGAAYMAVNTVSGSYGMGSGTHEGIHNLEILFSNPNSTSAYKSISWLGNIVTAAGTLGYIAGCGMAGTISAVDGLRFYMSSGNIASGNFYFYGLRKT